MTNVVGHSSSLDALGHDPDNGLTPSQGNCCCRMSFPLKTCSHLRTSQLQLRNVLPQRQRTFGRSVLCFSRYDISCYLFGIFLSDSTQCGLSAGGRWLETAVQSSPGRPLSVQLGSAASSAQPAQQLQVQANNVQGAMLEPSVANKNWVC